MDKRTWSKLGGAGEKRCSLIGMQSLHSFAGSNGINRLCRHPQTVPFHDAAADVGCEKQHGLRALVGYADPADGIEIIFKRCWL